MSNDYTRDTDERTWHWKNGDVVTSKATGDTGLVKWTNRRQSDGKRFLRVRLTSGPKADTECWGNNEFEIGTGAKWATCADCGFGFRTDDERPLFCPCCVRHQRPNEPQPSESKPTERRVPRYDPYAAHPIVPGAPESAKPGKNGPEHDPFLNTPF